MKNQHSRDSFLESVETQNTSKYKVKRGALFNCNPFVIKYPRNDCRVKWYQHTMTVQ